MSITLSPSKVKELKEFVDKYRNYQLDPKTTEPYARQRAKFETSKCFYKRWLKVSKAAYLAELAAPKPVRLQPWPNPQFQTTLPIPVSRAALAASPTRRLIELAKPKRKNPKFQPFRSGRPKRRHGGGWSGKQPLADGKYFPRTANLSKPKPKVRYVHVGCLRTEYPTQKYYRPKRYAIRNMDDWNEHIKWLRKNAMPRRKFKRPAPKRAAIQMQPSQYMEMLNRLTYKPSHKKVAKKKPVRAYEPRPPGQIVPLPFEWIQRLSKPRKLASETRLNLEYDPAVIPRGALRAVPSKRTQQLAEPKIRSRKVDTEHNENAFKVSPLALKYRITKRIKALSKPRVRK
ncbi:uncharacterized protein LOC126839539 [Adelges cooleyi]|uniref:uncharacterized protein LOC126839539 n=1 Tax=Adelges cooleyi TaxID=133065 RepID=UPI00217FC627|nr:uncharacterized protein LOC126839539 [Adelges cooleyi]